MKNPIYFIVLTATIVSACSTSEPIPYSVHSLEELDKYGITRYKEDGKYGYVDSNNRAVIPIEYDYLNAINFTDGRIHAEKNDLHGLISRTNEVIIPIEYDMVSEVSRGWKFYYARKGDNITIYDSDGNLVYPEPIHRRTVSSFNSLFFSNILHINNPNAKSHFCYSLKQQKKYHNCEEICLSLATGYRETCMFLPNRQKTYQKTYMSYTVKNKEKCIDVTETPIQCPPNKKIEKIEDYLPEIAIPHE